ncbi:MAG TPA: flippase-like domain-containing protein [Methanosarcinaceae archaeon]|nr:flippase-like domain-containing protein [Methanosarcinaceae archaeon]
MSKLKKLLNTSLLISTLSIVVVLIFTVDSTTIAVIMEVKHEYIIAAAALHAFSYLIWGLRTKFMCQGLGYHITTLKAAEIVTSSTLVASITPASAGGEPVRIHLLHKNKIPIGHATAVVIGERVMDAILLLSLVPFVLFIFHDVLSNDRLDAIFMLAEALAILAFGLMTYGMWKPLQIKRLLHFIVNRIAHMSSKNTDVALSKILARVDSEFDNFHNSIWIFLTQGKKGLLYGIVCTILFWIVEYSILLAILLGLDQNPSIIIVFAAQVLLSIIMAMAATPGASGVAELGATTLFSVFVIPSLLGITVVAWRALTFYMNILVGSFVSAKILKDTDQISKLLGD